MSEPMPTWQQNPVYAECEMLAAGDGDPIAYLEDFDYAASQTGNWERGGPYSDRVAAKLWAERVAGLHPLKPGDERPPFYHAPVGT